jgi:hypothetical protein
MSAELGKESAARSFQDRDQCALGLSSWLDVTLTRRLSTPFEFGGWLP